MISDERLTVRHGSEALPLTWTEIDLDIIRQNVQNLCRISRAPLMAVVKANAYGHGAVEVARAALASGAAWLGVARVSEGIGLVRAGITAPILVLGPVAPVEVDEAIDNGLVLSLYNFEIGEVYLSRTQALGRALSVHLKVDTGMGRLGVLADEVGAMLHLLAGSRYVHLEGVFTHLARAGDFDLEYTRLQMTRFQTALQALQEAGLSPAWIHVANSAAVFTNPELHFNMVRVGAALYGLSPSSGMQLHPQIRPALVWKARLSSCKNLPANWGVSYSHEYVNVNPELIGVLPVGYADGWRRVQGNLVLIDEQRVPIVGRICMDLCMVRLPYPILPGSEVVILGQQGSEVISAEDIAARWGTSSLDVVSAISARVPRFYLPA